MLDEAKTIMEIIGSITTTAAVVVGGIWAYFRFFKERTYEPRLEVTLSGEWLEITGSEILAVRIAVKNIGKSQIFLPVEESMIIISEPVDYAVPIQDIQFRSLGAYAILQHHAWVESEETIHDELLFNVGPRPAGVQLESVMAPAFEDRGEPRIHLRAKHFVSPLAPTTSPNEDGRRNIISIGKTEINDGGKKL